MPVYQVIGAGLRQGDVPTGLQPVLNVGGHVRGMTSCSFASDCVHLALASLDGEWYCTESRAASTISLVDVEAARAGRGDGSVLQTIETGHGRISALVYSSEGMRVLTGGHDCRLRLWRVEDDESKAGTL